MELHLISLAKPTATASTMKQSWRPLVEGLVERTSRDRLLQAMSSRLLPSHWADWTNQQQQLVAKVDGFGLAAIKASYAYFPPLMMRVAVGTNNATAQTKAPAAKRRSVSLSFADFFTAARSS